MIPPNTILMHMDATPRSATRLAVAAALAERHNAAVTALYVASSTSATRNPLAISEGTSLIPTREPDPDREARQCAREIFETAQAGPRVVWAEMPDSAPIEGFVREALVADLLVLGQHHRNAPSARAVPADFVESVVIESGKPAVVVPWAGEFATVGRNVLVAWKARRESARALSASLPLLLRAERVHVASWGEDPRRVEHFLLRHGIDDVQFHHEAEAHANLGEYMLSRADAVGADLLVMGCYGHARVRELVLGGASRTVLDSMTLPVLMVH